MRKYSIQIAALIIIMAVMVLYFNSCQKLDYGNQTKSKIENISKIDGTAVKVDAYVFDLSSYEHADYGICYSINDSFPSISDSKVSKGPISSKLKFSTKIENLLPETKYFFRAYVMDENVPLYSLNSMEVTTLYFVPGSSVVDIEGNTYNTIIIGTQTWMKENLKTTRYQNGDLIGTTDPPTLDISGESIPKFEWAYDGNESNVETYGRLYTWFATIDSRNICPVGWHIPSDEEWSTLINELGDESVAGGKLKEAGFTHWSDPNAGADNSSGFTGLPGGYRDYYGSFSRIGYGGYWWSSTESDAAGAWYWSLSYYYSDVFSYSSYKDIGHSVRCIKDSK